MGAVAEVIDQSSAEEQTKPKSRVSGPLIADQAYGAPEENLHSDVFKQQNLNKYEKYVIYQSQKTSVRDSLSSDT